MRRRIVFGLVGVVLVVGVGAYTAYWWIEAGKIEAAAVAWRDSVRAEKIDASWRTMHVGGYPFSFRLELTDATLKNNATLPAAALQAPTLTASIRPWNFSAAWFDAPDGLNAALGPEGLAFAKIGAEHGEGAVAFAGDGPIAVWLSLYQAKADAGVAVAAKAVHVWATLPAKAPTTHQDAGFAFAAALHDLAPPAVPPGFKGTIDDVDFSVTTRGAFPSGSLAQAAAKWRDDGGTLDLDHFGLRWGEIEADGSGTLALDGDLQPTGAFSGGIAGFDQLLTALVTAGRVKASDARIARLALAMLAKPGPDGRPEISTSFAIQNGEMFLGPAKLGKAPRIDW
jgi:hypothetical protein